MSVLNRIAYWLDRREVCVLRADVARLKEDRNALRPRITYLEGRDALCSSLAHTVNRQAFEIAKLKGEYDHSKVVVED